MRDVAGRGDPPQPSSFIWHCRDLLLAHPWVTLAILTLIVRGPTIGLAEINWDESAFALVAREILNGHWPFTAVFDHKPIGLYLHVAAAQLLFGDDPIALRLAGMIVVTCSAWIIHHTAARVVGLSDGAAMILAATFVVATAGFDGFAIYSEHFVNFYLLGSLALIVGTRSSVQAILAGMLAGVAFQTNYLALPIALAAVLGWVLTEARPEKATMRTGSLFVVGFLLAAVILVLTVLLTDPASYFGPQLAFIAAYREGEGSAVQQFVHFFRYFAIFVPLVLAGILLGRNRLKNPGGRLTIFLLSALGALVAILVSGRLYSHYFLLLIPPLWLAAAELAKSASPSGRRTILGIVGGTSLVSGLQGLEVAATGARDLWGRTFAQRERVDLARRVAEEVSESLNPGETIYAACAPPVLYQLVSVRPPTRYPFYIHHLDAGYAEALGITPEGELVSIFARRPGVVVIGDYPRCIGIDEQRRQMVVQAATRAGYRPYASLGGYRLYRRDDRP